MLGREGNPLHTGHWLRHKNFFYLTVNLTQYDQSLNSNRKVVKSTSRKKNKSSQFSVPLANSALSRYETLSEV